MRSPEFTNATDPSPPAIIQERVTELYKVSRESLDQLNPENLRGIEPLTIFRVDE